MSNAYNVLLLIGFVTIPAWCARAQEIPPERRALIEQAVPAKAFAKPVAPRRLLVVSLHVRDGKPVRGHESIPYGNLAIDLMGRRTGAYEAVFSNDMDMFRPDKLRQFDAVCFNNTAGVLFEDADRRKALLEFVADGKGLVGIHAAAATFVQWPRYDQWPEFGEMLGTYENGGHPWKPHETITIRGEDPSHPLTAPFNGRSFQISDEVFQFQHPYSRQKLRILLSIDTERTDMNPARRFLPERAADRDFPISWIRVWHRGRVFYCSLGHNPHIFWNAPVLAHYLAGIQHCLGDLAADAMPLPESVRKN